MWGNKSLTDISEWIVIKWRNEKLKAGMKPSSINKPVSALKALLNRATEWGVITSNPLAKVKSLREDKSGVVRYLTQEEEQRLRNAIKSRQDDQIQKRESHNQWLTQRKQDTFMRSS